MDINWINLDLTTDFSLRDNTEIKTSLKVALFLKDKRWEKN